MSRDSEKVWDALMTAQSLIDDLVALNSAGLDTGFKPVAVTTMKTENAEAFAALANMEKLTG